jgi:hypothetical protein
MNVEARILRLLMAAVIVFVQFAAAAMATPMDSPRSGDDVAALFAGEFICHADGEQDNDQNQAPLQQDDHGHDCVLCLSCHLATPPVLPVPADSFIPVPSEVFLGRIEFIPPAVGPPALLGYSASPRGPPPSAV